MVEMDDNSSLVLYRSRRALLAIKSSHIPTGAAVGRPWTIAHLALVPRPDVGFVVVRALRAGPGANSAGGVVPSASGIDRTSLLPSRFHWW